MSDTYITKKSEGARSQEQVLKKVSFSPMTGNLFSKLKGWGSLVYFGHMGFILASHEALKHQVRRSLSAVSVSKVLAAKA